LEELGFKYNNFESGVIEFEENLSPSERRKLNQSFQQYGLEVKFVKNDLLSKIRHVLLN